MIHTSYWCPRVYPYNGDTVPSEIDRLQDLTATVTLNKEKIREIGRDGIIDWRERIPSTRVTLRQLEYGQIEFWRKLTNVADSTTAITLNDFKTAMVDVVGYKTDDAGTFLGSVWYPKMRTSGFGITIGDPQANIERSFDLIGEDENILQGSNKYFNYQRFVASGGAPESITVNSPSPVADPANSGQYLFRVIRYTPSSGTTTELTYSTATPTVSGTTFKFVAPSTLTVGTVAGDIVRVYYSAATFNTNSQTAVFTNNNADVASITADSASIYLYVSADNYVYKLQSVGIDCSFDRTDYYEIGSKEVIQRGVRDKTVRVTLGRILDAYTIEEVLAGKVAGYGRVDTRNFQDATTLRVKLYGNNLKNTFHLGYKITGLAPTGLDAGVPLNDYATRNATLEADNMTISSVEATINL
jgi:hypothetical protein